MNKKYKIVFITDLEHSAPRISNFIHYMKKESDFDISLIGSDYNNYLNASDFPKDFNVGFNKFLFKRKFNLMQGIRRYYVNINKKILNQNLNRKSKSNFFKGVVKQLLFSIKSFFVNLYLRLNFPDQYIYTCFKYLKLYSDNFDGDNTIIISSSPYMTSHISAFLIKKKHPNVKWIADYRDLWSFNHNYSFGKIRKYIDLILERKIINSCDLITTVSKPWALKLNSHFNKETHVIRNGFSIVKENSKINLLSNKSEKLYFLYVGTISFNISDFEIFINGIKNYLKETNNVQIEIHFCGNFSDKLDILISKNNFQSFIKQIGRFNRKETILLKKKYDYLFYFDCISDPGVLLLKFYEYINACRPILAFGNNKNSESGKIINKLNRGIYFTQSNDFTDFLKNKKNINEFDLRKKKNTNYSYKYQSMKLIELIKNKF